MATLVGSTLTSDFIDPTLPRYGTDPIPAKLAHLNGPNESSTPTGAPHRIIRRHHDRHGRHYRFRHLHEPVSRCAAGSHSVSRPGRVGTRRVVCTLGRIYLG